MFEVKYFLKGKIQGEKCYQYDHFNIIPLKHFAVLKGPEERD